VSGAVGDEFGDVLGADEDRLEFAAERRAESAVGTLLGCESRIGEQSERIFV